MIEQEISKMSLDTKKQLLKMIFNQEKEKIEDLIYDATHQEKELGTTLEDIEEQLVTVFTSFIKLPKDKISTTRSLKNYDLDSMHWIGFIRRVNHHFSLNIELEKVVELETLQELSNFIFQRYKQSGQELVKDEKPNEKLVTSQQSVISEEKKDDPSLADFETISSRKDEAIQIFNDYMEKSGFSEFSRPHAVNPVVSIGDQTNILNFANYDYLGYATHPDVIAAAKQALDQYGLGATASPVAGGRLGIHDEFENELLQFFGKKDTGITLFPTGYNAVFGTISAYMGKADHVVMDAYAHASIVDGAVHSKTNLHFFMHNDMEDLEIILKTLDDGKNRILICTEGVFSADGDFGNLKEVVSLAKKYGAKTLVDEAHSLLLTGKHGLGACSEQGVLEEVDLLVGTFSKSFAGIGGFLLARKAISNYVSIFARNRLFSCALGPAVTAGMLASFKLAKGKNGDERRKRLLNNSTYLISLLQNRVKLAETETWIVPVIFGKDELALKLSQYLMKNGCLGSMLTYPSAPKGKARIRLFITANHTEAHLKQGAKIVLKAAEEFEFML